MAFTLEQLQAQRDALHELYVSSVAGVDFQDRSVRYQNVDDMRKALADLDADIASTGGTYTRRSYAAFSKGE